MNAQLVCGIAGQHLSQTRISQFYDMLVAFPVIHPLAKLRAATWEECSWPGKRFAAEAGSTIPSIPA